MKRKTFIAVLLILAGSNASVASVPSGIGDVLTATMTGVGTTALRVDESGAASLELIGENSEKNYTDSLISDELIQWPLQTYAWIFASVLVGFTVVARRKSL